MAKEAIANGTIVVRVPSHPLIKHWISVLRNEQTPCVIFKNAMAELGRLLIYEASRDWLLDNAIEPSERSASLYIPAKTREIMRMVALLVLGVLLLSSCFVTPRKVLMEEIHGKQQAQAEEAVENYGNSDANTSNHHHIPRDQYNNWISSPGGYVPGNGGDVGSQG